MVAYLGCATAASRRIARTAFSDWILRVACASFVGHRELLGSLTRSRLVTTSLVPTASSQIDCSPYREYFGRCLQNGSIDSSSESASPLQSDSAEASAFRMRPHEPVFGPTPSAAVVLASDGSELAELLVSQDSRIGLRRLDRKQRFS
jgi:hypothetical protein